MSSLFFGALALAGLVGAGAQLLSSNAAPPLERARRRARRLGTIRVADLEHGVLARVTGRVELDGEGLVAPASGRRCAHHELWVGSMDPGGPAPLVLRASQDLWLRDETGLVRVRVERALVEAVLDLRIAAAELDVEARFELERVLVTSGDPRAEALLSRRERLYYAEGVIEPGELATAVGVVGTPRPAPTSAGYRDRGVAFVLEAPPAGELFLSDSLCHE